MAKRSERNTLLTALTAASALVAVSAVTGARAQTAAASWPSSGNGPNNDGASKSEIAISRTTVGSLKLLWTLQTTGEVPDTPTVEAGSVYLSDSGGSVWRVDAATGTPMWHRMLPALTGNSMSVSRNSPAIGPSQVIVGDQAAGALYSLDKSNGNLLWTAHLDHARGAIITSSPVIVGNRVYVGVSSGQEELAATVKGFVPSFRGSVASVDLATGKIIWQTYTVPQGFTGGAVWGSNIAVDPARGALFIGTGDNYTVPPDVAACQASAKNGAQLDRCLPVADHIDSVMSLNMADGSVKWAQRTQAMDTWTVSCLQSTRPPATPCPEPHGLDYDFGSAPNLFTSTASGAVRALVGAGQKSGAYWAFDRDTGKIVWGTQVNPGGTRGGIEWGSAVGGGRIFVPASNSAYVWSGLVGTTKQTDGGYWSALDAATGQIVWQTPTLAKQPKPANKNSRTQLAPAGALARTEGAVSYANGVMFGADEAGNFAALDGQTGALLWSFASGGAAIDAPSVVNGMVFWGDGYGDIGPTKNRLLAFGLPAS